MYVCMYVRVFITAFLCLFLLLSHQFGICYFEGDSVPNPASPELSCAVQVARDAVPPLPSAFLYIQQVWYCTQFSQQYCP